MKRSQYMRLGGLAAHQLLPCLGSSTSPRLHGDAPTRCIKPIPSLQCVILEGSRPLSLVPLGDPPPQRVFPHGWMHGFRVPPGKPVLPEKLSGDRTWGMMGRFSRMSGCVVNSAPPSRGGGCAMRQNRPGEGRVRKFQGCSADILWVLRG